MRVSPRFMKYVLGLGAHTPDTFEDWIGFLDRFLRGMLNEAVTYEGDFKVWHFAKATREAMEDVWDHRNSRAAELALNVALDAAGGLNDRIHELRRETLRRAKEGIEVWSAKSTSDYWLFEATHGRISKAPPAMGWAQDEGLGATMNRLRSEGFQLKRVP